jgi:hypothetical protein
MHCLDVARVLQLAHPVTQHNTASQPQRKSAVASGVHARRGRHNGLLETQVREFET